MSTIFQRIASLLLRVEEKWNALKTRPLPKWGIAVFAVAVFGLFVFARPALAQETGPGALDTALLFLAGLFMALAQIVGQLVVALLDIAAIPLMQYNGYGSSPVVAAGWAIVRDVVNMFFVIVLIVIAFGTIFGSSRFQWKQQVPKLLIFAIVINFSKTLAVLMIDFGQVIMLSFANAIKDIAGGNFIQLLGLGDILSVSRQSDRLTGLTDGSANAEGPAAFDWLAASVMAFLMMILVLVTMVTLTVILAWRIVMLWVLITISPLAWFMGGAGDILRSDAYADWWKQFKCYVAIGPVITFFVWLTLAVAGAGSIATSDTGFSTNIAAQEINQNPTGGLLAIFELPKMTSFIIGIAMLFAGFQAASTTCNAVPGVGNAFGRSAGALQQRAARLARGTAGLAKRGAVAGAGAAAYGAARGARGGLRLARTGAGLAANEIAGQAARSETLRPLTAGGRAEMYRRIAKAAPGGVIGRNISKTASTWASGLEGQVSAGVKEAGAGTEGLDREGLIDYLKNAAKSGPPALTGARNEMKATLGRALKDPKALEALDASGDLQKLLTKDMLSEMKQDFGGDKDMFAQLEALEDARPDLTGDIAGIKSFEAAQKLAPEALANAEVQEQLRGQLSGKNYPAGSKDKDGNDISGTEMTMLEALRRSGSTKKRKAIDEGMAGLYSQMSDKLLATVPPEKLVESLTGSLASKPAVATNILSNASPETLRGLEVSLPADVRSALMNAGAGVDVASGRVTNPETFKSAVASNPSIVAAFNPAQTPELAQATAGALDQKAISRAIGQINKDPSSEASKTMRSNIEQTFNIAQGDTNVSADVKNNAEYFTTQMGAVDNARAQAAAQKLEAAATTLEEHKQILDQIQSQIVKAEENIESALDAGDYATATKLDKQLVELKKKEGDAGVKVQKLEGKK